MKCPKCGHTWKSENQTAGGIARWSGMTKKQRKAAASAAAKARWAKTKRVAEPANAEVRDRRPGASDLSATAIGGSLH